MNARSIRASRQSGDREAPDTLNASAQFAPLPAGRGRLRNLLADCCTLAWSLLRNKNTEINLKCSLQDVQVTVVGVLPHVTRARTRVFSTHICFSSRPVRLGDICVF